MVVAFCFLSILHFQYIASHIYCESIYTACIILGFLMLFEHHSLYLYIMAASSYFRVLEIHTIYDLLQRFGYNLSSVWKRVFDSECFVDPPTPTYLFPPPVPCADISTCKYFMGLCEGPTILTYSFIHAAPRQGPPAPSLQGVICSSCSCSCSCSCCSCCSCCCCCCWFLVKYFGSKTSKNTVFCTFFVLVKEKTLVFTTFWRRQGRKYQKHRYLQCFLANA